MVSDWQPPSEGPRIYGLRVREPLTLGHAFLLDELESPILHGGTLLPGDIALAAFVCSMPHRKAREQVQHRSTRLGLLLWGRLAARCDHDAAATAFAEWFHSQAKAPARWFRSGSNARECAAPWWINRAASAMGLLGLSFDEALDAPLKRLCQLAMAFAESRGEVELVTPREIEFREMCARLDREREMSARN